MQQLRVARGVDAALAGQRLDRVAGHQADQDEREQVIPMKVGIRTPRRVRMKRSIAALPRPAHARFPPDRPSLPLSRPPGRRDVPPGKIMRQLVA